MFAWVKSVLWDDPHQRWFLASLLLVNAPGSVYGYYWYQEQLAAMGWWLFVPDSPLASTLFTAALVLLLAGKRAPLFELWAYTAVIKYGLWAMAVITDYWLGGGPMRPTEWMLWLSHGGMALEGWLFLRHLAVKSWQVVLLAAWMLLNDYLDYGRGLHPYLFAPGQEPVALATALVLTALVTVMASRGRDYATGG